YRRREREQSCHPCATHISCLLCCCPASFNYFYCGTSMNITSISDALPVALTIAGSDSGGGAGIQADLKTFAALGVYGCSALSSLTAQNTCGVQGVFAVPPDFVKAQIHSVLSDIPVGAIKTGMLATADIIAAVAQALTQSPLIPLVLDPVMVATSGDRLLAED